MPFASTAQQRFAFGTHQPWAKRWAKETDFSKIPKRVRKKMAAAGVPLSGPGGLLGFPGGRKWGNRRKASGCTCGENVATKEQLAPGVTRIRGNLCNVHGRYGPCDGGSSGRKPKGGKGKKGRAPAKPKQTPEQRAQARAAEQATNRAAVDKQLGLPEDTVGALDDLRAGKAVDDDGGLVKMGLAEQSADGSYRLTPAGRALVAARNAGDAGRARDIMSGAKDRTLARNARETAAELRREAADKRKRDAEAKRAEAAKKKPKAGGGGGKGKQPKGGGDTSGADTRAQREQERQADRARRQQEHEQDRAQRQREHAEDRAQRQRERSEDRAAQLEARRQRQGGATRVPPSRSPIVLHGGPNTGTRRRAPAAPKKDKPMDRRQTTKAQTAQDRAMFAKMGGGGKGGGGGKAGGGSKLWARDPKTGKRTPTDDQRDAQQQREVRRLAVSDKQRDAFARRAGDKAEHEIRGRYRIESAGDGEWTLRDYNRATSSYRGVSVASGNRDKVDRALGTKIRTARTRAENDARQSVDFYNSDLRRGMYPNPSSAKRDQQKFKSFTVFKDDTDAYRWLTRTTTAYRDRDGEIITTKALEDDAARMTATKQYGPLRYWHIGQPDPLNPAAPWGVGLDIGQCDYSIVIGRTSIESGTFNSHAIGQAFAESAQDYEISPGFFHPPSEPNAAGEYHTIRRFERSVVPVKYGRASNLFTGMTVKEHRMDQSTYDARVKAFLEDMNTKGVPEHAAAAALAGMQQADKSAEQQGIAYKSDDAPAVYTAPDGTPGIILDGRFVALKAAAMDAEDDPALGGDSGVDEAAEGEPPIDDSGDSGEYIGDMTPAEFWDQLKSYLADILAPQAKMEELTKSLTAGLGEMKALYSTKDSGALARITALEAELATLKGDVPAVTMPADIDAALKSSGPQAPPDPNAPQIPNDPARPLAALAARTMPSLYSNTPDGQWTGWQPPTMPPSQS